MARRLTLEDGFPAIEEAIDVLVASFCGSSGHYGEPSFDWAFGDSRARPEVREEHVRRQAHRWAISVMVYGNLIHGGYVFCAAPPGSSTAKSVVLLRPPACKSNLQDDWPAIQQQHPGIWRRISHLRDYDFLTGRLVAEPAKLRWRAVKSGMAEKQTDFRERHGDFWYVSLIGTHPDYQHQHLARAALEGAIAAVLRIFA